MRPSCPTVAVVLALSFSALCSVGCASRGSKDRDKKDDDAGDDADVQAPKPTTGTIAASANVAKIEIQDFYEFSGLKFGDDLAAVTAKFGKPVLTDDDPQYKFVTRYYGKSTGIEPLSVTTWRANNKIYTISIEAKTTPTPKAIGVNDPTLRLTTMDREGILRTLGRAKDPQGSFLEYGWTDDNDRQIEVMLWCGDEAGKICSSMEIFWHNTDEL